MIRLTVKGREREVLAELHTRNLAPVVVMEEASQFVSGLYTCSVSLVSTEDNMNKVHAWWADDEGRLPGAGFREGALFIYSEGL